MGKELTSLPIRVISLQRFCTDCEHALPQHWLVHALASCNPTHEHSVVKPDAPRKGRVRALHFFALSGKQELREEAGHPLCCNERVSVQSEHTADGLSQHPASSLDSHRPTREPYTDRRTVELEAEAGIRRGQLDGRFQIIS